MKALILVISIISISLLTAGCASPFATDGASEDPEVLEPKRPENLPDPDLSAKLGYVRYTADEADRDSQSLNEMTIDRAQMAEVITKVILQSGSFEEAASLVTDDDIVIAYKRKPETDQETASDIATRTAKSLLPSFYNIYVTDNPLHMNDIHSLHLSETNTNREIQTIEKIIRDISNQKLEPERR